MKPSPGGRKFHLMRHESQTMINEMLFVTNEHVLVQLMAKYVPLKQNGQVMDAEAKGEDFNQTVIFKTNGKVVN